MKTTANKNRIETDRGFAPQSRCRKKTVCRIKKAIKWVTEFAVVATVAASVWIMWGIGKTIAGTGVIKFYHLLIAFLVLRWFCKKGNTTLKTAIIIAIILILNQ